MRSFEELLLQYCPNGVPYKRLGEIGFFYGGLTGKTKNDFSDGNARYITYMNVYLNKAVDLSEEDYVKIGANERQNTVDIGDILFTGSSETKDECAISSVVTKKPSQELYLNSFCFGFRLHDRHLLKPEFAKYLFRSSQVRSALQATASGVTRFNVSKEKMAKVEVPLPPLDVQDEIASALDRYNEIFIDLISELKRELEVRKKQFSHYRDVLLSYDSLDTRQLSTCPQESVKWMTLGEISKKVSSGGTPKKSHADYYGGTIPWLRTQEVRFNEIFETEGYISELGLQNSSAKWIPANCVIIAISGATAARCAINRIPLTTNQHCCNFEINGDIALYKYVYHWVCANYKKLKALGRGARDDLNAEIIKNYPIAIPSLAVQEEIVSILDAFERVENEFQFETDKEIQLRSKRYTYYADTLLSFPRAV